jgi:hypothetical protein
MAPRSNTFKSQISGSKQKTNSEELLTRPDPNKADEMDISAHRNKATAIG